MEKVENYAADDHLLNHVRTSLSSVSGTQSDCPRFSATYTKVDNFNLSTGVPQEIEVTNSLTTGASYSLPGGLTGTATRIDVAMTGHPDGLYSRTFVAESGWKEGLRVASEDCIGSGCSDRKRWRWTEWTQDDTGAVYRVNPRVVESRVGDGTNVKKSSIDYWLNTGTSVAIYGLVKSAFVFDTDLSTVLKKTYTTYNMDSAYTSRRIIGLPSMTEFYGKETTGLNLVSKVTYDYDEGNFSDGGLQQSISPTQHDTTNFSSSFVIGRGNLTSTTRWNVEYATNSAYAITSSTKYNTAGSPVAEISPWDGTNTRTIRIGYADVWNDNVARTTYAYPTIIVDPAGTSLEDTNHRSTVKYRYDLGVNVEANSPAPAGNSTGKRTVRTYDDLHGRLLEDAVWRNNESTWIKYAYTRYEYPTSGIQSKVYSTIVDTDSDGADADDEVLSETFLDGAGRVRMARTPHTFSSGSTATWAGVITEYDILGRVKRQSVPTEVNSSWAAAGDDSAGFRWTYQKYDWKGRVVRKINTDGEDGTTLSDTDILISYDGCGCAGGQQTTVEFERVLVPGTSGFARRKRKIYEDVLGRAYKTEMYDWDGTTVYATTVDTLNARDQVMQTRQYAGSTSSSTYQDTTATYDGHGRLATSHKPEQQNSNGSAAHTSYTYNQDDSVASITDARGAVTNYTYNDLGLTTVVNYSAPTGIAVPADIEFGYDTLGNRTSMSDALGTLSLSYDSLSRLTSETRIFDDSLVNSPNSDSTYQIQYTYNLNGQLSTLTEPFGTTFEYGYDKMGRPTSAKPTSAYGDLSANQNVISGIQYRAFGLVKQADYANGTQMTATYNNRLQPATYRVKNTSNNQILFGEDYYFTTGTNGDNDGRLKRSVYYDDRLDTTSRLKKNRTNTYDAFGRIISSDAGKPGYVPASSGMTNGAFRLDFGYDAFDHVTQVNDIDFETYVTGCFACPRPTYYSETFVNNRTTAANWSASPSYGSITPFAFDEDGRLKTRGSETYVYDATGQRTSADMTGDTPDPAYAYDGDQKLVKVSYNGTVANYHLISSVLGSPIADLTATGGIATAYIVSSGGTKLARLQNNTVSIIYNEPMSQDQSIMAMDKTVTGGQMLDPLARVVSYAGYTGGGPCAITSCPAAYNPPGGFDGLAIMMARHAQQRWQDSVFWNLAGYMNLGVVVGSEPPRNWDPYRDNLNRISDPRVCIPGGSLGERGGEGTQWRAPFVFDAFVSTGSSLGGGGKDVKEEAKRFYNVFLNDPKNKDCAEVVKALGLDKVLQESSFIDPTGDSKLLNTTLKNLGSKDASYNHLTLAQAMEGDKHGSVGARTVWEAKTVYFNSTDGPAFEFAYTVFHEVLHLAKGNHIEVAKALGLAFEGQEVTPEEQRNAELELRLGNKNYKPKTITLASDEVAKQSIKEFLDKGCKKK